NLLNDCPEDAIDSLSRAIVYHSNEPYSYFLLAKAQVRYYQLGMRKAVYPVSSTLIANQPQTLLEQIARSYAFATVLTECEQYKPLRAAIDYDMQILGNTFGPAIKVAFARAIDSVLIETSASTAKPPEPAASTVRP